MLHLLEESDPSPVFNLQKKYLPIPKAIKSAYNFYDLRSENIYYRHALYQKPPVGKIEIVYQNDYIQFIYLIAGKCVNCFTASGKSLFSLSQGEFALFHHKKNQNRLIEICDDSKTELCIINISLDFFNATLKSNEILKNAFQKISNNQYFTQININLDILECIKKINTIDEIEKGLSYTYLEIKAQELILLSYQQYFNQFLQSRNNIDPDIYQKMIIISEFLNENIAKEHSLKNLSSLICTNTAYLKINFKKVFNKTVFEFLNALRMQRAKDLIKNQKLSIAETANLVGYKHATHFTSAFKKFYGVLPSAVNKLFALILFAI
jgi:AraC-like DNA-binding protein